jgi:hypothetical protein
MAAPTVRQTEMAEWVSPAQAARLLDLTTARLRQMALDGRIFYAQTPMGRVFNRAEIERLAAERRASGRKKSGPKPKREEDAAAA